MPSFQEDCQINRNMSRPRPDLCSFLAHCCRRFQRMELGKRELWGVTLLVLNFVIGWGGPLICSSLAEAYKLRWLHIVSLAIYGASWGVLFLGAWLAGPKVAKNCKQIIPSGWRAWRRRRAML